MSSSTFAIVARLDADRADADDLTTAQRIVRDVVDYMVALGARFDTVARAEAGVPADAATASVDHVTPASTSPATGAHRFEIDASGDRARFLAIGMVELSSALSTAGARVRGLIERHRWQPDDDGRDVIAPIMEALQRLGATIASDTASADATPGSVGGAGTAAVPVVSGTAASTADRSWMPDLDLVPVQSLLEAVRRRLDLTSLSWVRPAY
ncbi:hypothetical protein GCM10027515_10440 [Schumannella luteola]|uniref:Uncharacterized protein n=1 Tax=Schumannella luteola TaxID=472059 RepID=A0A852Y5H8_9MICO|nr:hypothetical protein [Schumannella luteola]NYG97493.1 hypothetical protein [Schumannella luteola]TPX01517.1 hypothetical protein FJ656_26990 [Schumannella luteola]